MWRSPPPKGILGDSHLTHMITSRYVMSDPYSFLSITTLFWITGIWTQSFISRLVLSASDICGDFTPEVDGTVYTGDTILHNKRQQSDVIQNWSVRATRGRREKLTCSERERWTWRYLQIPLRFRSQWPVCCGYCRCIFYNRTNNSFRFLTDIVDRLKCVTNLLVFLSTHEISGMSYPLSVTTLIVEGDFFFKEMIFFPQEFPHYRWNIDVYWWLLFPCHFLNRLTGGKDPLTGSFSVLWIGRVFLLEAHWRIEIGFQIENKTTI